MSVKVYNLSNDEEYEYEHLEPYEAVILVHLTRTFNTDALLPPEERKSKYYDQLVFGRRTVSLGDWCAKLVEDKPW